jgi:translation initiation factor IF-3
MPSPRASGARRQRSSTANFFNVLRSFSPIALDSRSQRINREITAPEVRLVAENGDQLGIRSVSEALRLAEEANVDLVEIAPLANPPVCKLMDYGKFRYREQKKAHEAKLKQKQIQVKEIKFRPGTDEGDYKIKLGKLVQFLEEGDKAKVTLRFRGREMAHKEFGERLLQRVQKDLDAVGVVEQFPRLEGRQMVMVLAPKKKGLPPPKAEKPRQEKPSGSPKPAAAAKVGAKPARA